MSDLIRGMMTLRDQVKLYHWQTMKFPRHKATDSFVDKLDSNIDRFVEVYIGKYGRPKFSGSIQLKNYSDKTAEFLIQSAVEWLTRLKLNPGDTDLYAIRDEILADLNQTRYLFTLN